jgi:hypothetical protein
LQSAIDDQLKEGRGCPLSHCAFKEEIGQAILESKTPEVVLWDIDKSEIFENETITLSWEVLFAKKITISGLGEVPLKGNRTFSPIRNTTYLLSIQDYKDNIYEAEQKIDITVTPLPIVVFQSNKTRMEIGDTVRFSWTTQNINKVELFDGNLTIDVTNQTNYLVQLSVNTTYKLIITALDNKTTIEREIIIEVFPKPEIKYFKILPEVIMDSQPVTLLWKVENAKKIRINNGVGDVSPEGEKVDTYKGNTVYSITAYGELSVVSKTVEVRVFPTPIIESLKVPMPDFATRFSLSPVNIASPNINVSINLSNFNFILPKFTKPEVDLSKIKPLYKKKSIFKLLKKYEYGKRQSRI